MPGHAFDSKTLLLNTQSVCYAGRRLMEGLNAESSKREQYVKGLERAVQRHEDDMSHTRAFMFSESKTASKDKEDKAVIRTGLTEEALVGMLTDLQVANVLLAASGALGETGKKLDPKLFDDALRALENTSNDIEKSMARASSSAGGTGHFRFSAEAASEENRSAGPALPVARFKDQCCETLDVLVDEACEVVKSSFEALSEVGRDKVGSVMSSLGEHLQALPGAGRFFRYAIEKMRSVFNALANFFSNDTLVQIRKRVQDLWDKVKEGEHIERAIEWAFDVEDTKSYVKEVVPNEGLEKKDLDLAGESLSQLSELFKEHMSIAQRLNKTLVLGSGVLSLTPLAGPQLTIFCASGYALILAAVVLIGMDFADSGKLLQRVPGVREIVRGVLPAQS